MDLINMIDEPPCDECTGSCCISYDILALESREVEHFGVPHILIGSDGCQYLEKGRCSIHSERPQVCRDFDCRHVTSTREIRALTINGAPVHCLN
jgi:Fe-S-cluster containining protein